MVYLWRARLTCVLVIVIAILAGVRSASAQTTGSGTITGTVVDTSGAVVPNASVMVTNTSTGAITRLVTNPSGIYVAPALPIGTYQVAVTARGFQRSLRTGIVLNIASQVGVNFVLKIGKTTQTVEVKATPAMLQTQSGAQSTLITTRQLSQLPILGRNIFQLQQLIPGASDQAADEIGKGFYSTQGFSINGTNWRQTGILLDGVQNIDWGSNGNSMVAIGPDALAEFKVLAGNYSAKYGTASGAELIAVTKSGTRQFHGTAYEYVRNDKFDAADFFLNSANGKKSPLRYNDFGYNLGGPFYIPALYNTKKTKTFFFWDQEWIRERTATPIVAATPTLAMRNGDFTGLGPLRNPTDPATGQPMVDSSGVPCVGGVGMTQINPNCFNNNVQLLFKQDFPLPTPGVPGFFNFVQGATTGQNWGEDVIRVDQNITQSTRAFVRYVHDDWVEQDPTMSWSSDSFPTIHDEFDIPARNLVANVTTSFGPTLLNSITYGYSSEYGSQPKQSAPSGWALQPLGAIYLPSGYTAKTVFGQNVQNLVPDMTFGQGYGGISTLFGKWWSHENTSQFMDDLTKQLGRHTLQTGFVTMFSIGIVQSEFSPSRAGGYNFDGSFTGNAMADAVLGLPNTYTELSGFRGPAYNHHQTEAYFQDDWKATRHLTLNLGVRWFYIPSRYADSVTSWLASRYNPSQAPIVNPDGTIVPGSGNLLDGIVYPGKNGVPRGFVQNHWNTFGPRFGFAWDPRGGKTVIRGGYGTGYYQVEANDMYASGGNPPLTERPVFFNPPFNNPGAGTQASVPLSIATEDPIFDVPTASTWSFNVERSLSPSTVLSVGYVGEKGTHTDSTMNINQPLPAMGYQWDPRISCTPTTPYPCTTRVSVDYVRPYQGWSTINSTVPIGNSIYHSLQVKLNKKMSHGLMFGAAYTWSRDIGLLGAGGLEGLQPQNVYNIKADRGLTDFDRTQMLTMNYVYDSPFFRGLTGVPGAVLKGWEATGIVTFESGLPVDPGYSSPTAGLASRPDAVAGVSIPGPKTVGEWFNTAAFMAPPFGYFGNAAVNSIRGPGMNNWDMGWFKNFNIKERATVQFRAEMYNTWNHTNFQSVDATYGDSGFGQVTSAHTPRVIQFALRINF